ncbi:RNA-directed RNA polymerase [ssRNA phage SRR7976301_4]|uniref:RNA-directed RNA polymerase n=1 Tax=ssRNA phage SRR7976301_4 TaxID=2786665 RepID=A0A8S5L4T0_9VIRU|nr:RNA-directed RNA polymerase [ssRNA phage SRR7976301_4]DAD52689.1 TPA_asm: RNA-directed RNA polymerase [ssRNA phage SRR7976301_4]
MSKSGKLPTKDRRSLRSPNFLSSAVLTKLHKEVLDKFGTSLSLHLDLSLDKPGFRRKMYSYGGSVYTRESVLYRNFWSKYSSPGLPPLKGISSGVDVTPAERQQKAISKWLLAETRNTKTNVRLAEREVDFGRGVTSGKIIRLAQKYIADAIGISPPALRLGEYTNGASTRVKREVTAIAQKFEGKAHASLSAIPYFEELVSSSPLWMSHTNEEFHCVPVESSVMFTVPKNSGIDRVACKEPEVNMYLQRAYGVFIRNRMKRFGIDLQDQSRNRALARIGSRDRSYATLDLSSASDTISTEIVRQVLPPDWFNLLNALRVKSVVLPDGCLHQLQMFSSMGNGFTFELESLIFWVLARATASLIRARGRILVYGDDIVVSSSLARMLSRVLPWFGFIVNDSKSFIDGPFRESCGGWYTSGMDVTPIFYRERLNDMTSVIRLGNQIMGWLLAVPGYVYSGEAAVSLSLALWNCIYDIVPKSLHGGQSFERTDALVTGDAPRRRLQQISVGVEDVPMLGAYLQWHHEKERSPLQVSSPTCASVQGRWVTRPNKSWYEGTLCLDVRQVREVSDYSVIGVVH